MIGVRSSDGSCHRGEICVVMNHMRNSSGDRRRERRANLVIPFIKIYN